MNKIYMAGDFHFGIYKFKQDKWLKMMLDYFYTDFLPYIKNTYKEGDIFIFGGDLFDNRDAISVEVKYKAELLMKDIQDIIPTYMLIGNHDMSNKSTVNNKVNSIHTLGWLPNIKIINKPEVIKWKNLDLVLMPFFDKKQDMINAISIHKGDLAFVHSDLNGCRLNMNSVSNRNTDMIDVNYFKDYKHVYSSHVHIRQVLSNFTFIGSPYEQDRGDLGNQKGIQIIYEDFSTDFIPNKTSPIFEKIIIKKEEDLIKFDSINKNNYIDLEIYNSVIVNSRKTRKKIESILETGGFAKVDYINDLTKIDVITEDKANIITENIDFTKLNPTTDGSVEFDTIILNYINYIDYPSDKIKEGVIEEFELVKEKHKILYGNLHS